MKNPIVGYQDFNTTDDYKTTQNFTTYTKNGETIIPKGKLVKFVSLNHNLDPIIKFEHKGELVFEALPAYMLSLMEQSYLNSLVKLDIDVMLNTQDHPVLFKQGSTFTVDSVFYIDGVKSAMVTFFNEEENYRTTVSGVISFANIKEVIKNTKK